MKFLVFGAVDVRVMMVATMVLGIDGIMLVMIIMGLEDVVEIAASFADVHAQIAM